MKEQKTLNQWRKERGLEVDELAEKAGVGRQHHSWLYSGNIPSSRRAWPWPRRSTWT